jgi:hypothetical protein
MAFREVGVYEVREVLRLWLSGEGFRAIERLVGMDRKTVRRYLGVAEGLGLVRGGGEEQLTEVFMAMVVEAVRPHRTDGHGPAWRLLMASHDLIATWVEADLTAVTIHDRLGRRGLSVPSARCSATYTRCAGAAGDKGRRCGSPTASLATSARSTSAAWGSSTTP